jgi:hypothetical protein
LVEKSLKLFPILFKKKKERKKERKGKSKRCKKCRQEGAKINEII